MHAQADRANEEFIQSDFEPWVAAQRWLELAGERRVVIPFAHKLVDMIPATAVRMRRDFSQLLTVIQTIAALHQLQRERDHQGKIIATLDDYAAARWLLEEVFTATVHEVTPAIRQTVEAVALLSKNGSTVTEQALVKELDRAKSTIHYRVQRAVKSGFLVNQASQKGAPTQLVIGAPLSDGCPLPTTEDLLLCVADPGNDSNPRTPTADPAMAQVQLEGSNSLHSQSEEGFDGFPEGTTHKEPRDAGAADELPWDSFLKKESPDGTDAG